MGAVAGPVLRAGKLGLTGNVPSGQGFRAKPRRLWFVARSSASLAGEDLGSPAPLPIQSRLRDFWIPQRGIFLIGASSYDTFGPARHLLATARRPAWHRTSMQSAGAEQRRCILPQVPLAR